jgi:hypothetical protein
LTLITRDQDPPQWAELQAVFAQSLLQDYVSLIGQSDSLEDRADNLECAIAAIEAALTVYTREAFPQRWASTQNNLGLAYSDRLKGERADNLERAITPTRRPSPSIHARPSRKCGP